MTQPDLTALGEQRHETCRYGYLTEGYSYKAVSFAIVLDEPPTPMVGPMCRWQLPALHPPALRRAWGGDINFARDCAVCPVHETVKPKDWRKT